MKLPGSNQSKRSFTLVELMVSVSILAIGIVGVFRGIVANAAALGNGENRIEAARVLESRMALWDEKALQDNGLIPSHQQEDITFNRRRATLIQDVLPIDSVQLQEELVEVRLTLVWKEGTVRKDAVLAQYLGRKK